MKIEKLMNRSLLTLSMDSPLSKAKDLFENNNVHHAIITDENGLLAGVITDRDLYKHLSPTVGTSHETFRDTALMQKKLHLIMARNLITIQAQQSLNEAVLLLYDNNVSCLPVVNNQNEPIGIITWRDLLKILALRYKEKLAANI
ncbi:CBS domain-containing protein [Colwellia sp. 4_MG-2023]|uniref:CBS domain-containing protein n=1 Tax=unclassified Colwellia TaxID=196834 RepID=UPI0026E1CA96|nr:MULTISPECIES: CBS domain-containing protein [unclassified Colwellia]MDO6506653.1 CBS domain-containing protein [Colwellia sp. 5_MG-2023]MDO6555479.1 CBS domain-containing protein [Colwellia sp. 4_MG-2023]